MVIYGHSDSELNTGSKKIIASAKNNQPSSESLWARIVHSSSRPIVKRGVETGSWFHGYTLQTSKLLSPFACGT